MCLPPADFTLGPDWLAGWLAGQQEDKKITDWLASKCWPRAGKCIASPHGRATHTVVFKNRATLPRQRKMRHNPCRWVGSIISGHWPVECHKLEDSSGWLVSGSTAGPREYILYYLMITQAGPIIINTKPWKARIRKGSYFSPSVIVSWGLP